jgi:Ser/Thr protein kinase RdoA (MazF antagonist)
MPKFIVDLWLDGYEDEKELEKACLEFIYDQLDMTASQVSVTVLKKKKKKQKLG